jgi:gluconate 2-dehydrogenase gamma chain
MSDNDVSRRAFIGSAASLAAVWFGARHVAGAETASAEAGMHASHGLAEGDQQTTPTLQVLTLAQAADIDAFAAQLIPSDGTPGAREAGVVYFIDRGLATFAKEQRPLFEQGLVDLNARVAKQFPGRKTFSGLEIARQQTIIRALEKEGSPFFGAMRFATVAGMFSNPSYGGNRGKAGWKLIGFEDRYAWDPPFGWYDRDENRNG